MKSPAQAVQISCCSMKVKFYDQKLKLGMNFFVVVVCCRGLGFVGGQEGLFLFSFFSSTARSELSRVFWDAEQGLVMPFLEQGGFWGCLRTDVGDSKCPSAGTQPGAAWWGDKGAVTRWELLPVHHSSL